MANSKWNGFALGAAFGAVGLLAVKGLQNATTPNFANTIYGWFTSLGQTIIDSWSGFGSISVTVMAFAIAILAGGLIGLYTEVK